MLARYKRAVLSLACLIGLCFAPELPADPQAGARKPVETTITQLIESGPKFNGKRVRILASFHTDGIERTVLLEPNCGSKTPPPGAPQCSRGVSPVDSDKAESDPGNADLDRALAQSGRAGTMDKHITAKFTGIFRCVPFCASPKYFSLEIERVENLKVEMKDLKPHRPTDQPQRHAESEQRRSNFTYDALTCMFDGIVQYVSWPTNSLAKNTTSSPAWITSEQGISHQAWVDSCRLTQTTRGQSI